MITDAKIIPFLDPIKVFALIMQNQIYSLDFIPQKKKIRVKNKRGLGRKIGIKYISRQKPGYGFLTRSTHCQNILRSNSNCLGLPKFINNPNL